MKFLSALAPLVTTVLLATLAMVSHSALAQTQQQPFVIGVAPVTGGMHPYPPPAYFSAFSALNEGDYRSSFDLFRRNLNGAYRNGQNRWIDSICAYTMVGESLYRLGDYRAALENYENALRLYLQFSNWMLRVQFPVAITPSASVRIAPWGKSTRGSRPARFPDTFPILIGQSQAELQNTVRTGGPLMAQQMLSVQAQEIVRCTCLAMQRRRQILGPLVVHDSLTDDILAAAARRQGQPNHWSEAWLDVQQGMAYSAAGKPAQAVPLLQRSLTMAQGQYDHPVTGLALLELGNIALESGDYKTAAGYFEEATYTGFDYADAQVIEEGFNNLFLARLATNDSQTLETPLSLAAGWARGHLHELHATLLLLAAESAIIREQPQPAMALLKEAAADLTRRTMANCEIGSRHNHLTALAQYQLGQIAAGDESIKAALVWQKEGAKRLFQIALADNLSTGGRFAPRVATTLYQQLLRDPTPADWLLRPLESLAVLTTAHPLPFEHWFELVRQQSQTQELGAEASLEVADLARRHRFLTALPLGGRLLALRWVLEAPAETLDKQAQLERQELLSRYPKYAEAATKAKQLRAEIAQLGLKPEAHDAQHALVVKFNELAALSTTQENLLHEMALRRDAAEMVFPPVRKTKDIQHAMSPDQLLLVFFNTKQASYGWIFSNDRSAIWPIANPGALEKKTATLLKALGNVDATRDLPEATLTDESWQSAARDLSESLRNFKEPFKADFKELVIVPDGVLWYVPFEALPFGDSKENRPLISRMRVRYAPTVGLAMSPRDGRKTTPEVGVVLGKLFPGDSAEIAETALAQIQRVAPHALAVRSPLPAIAPLVGAMLDSLVVLDDLPTNQGPLDWSPIPIEKTKGAGSLSAWMTLPWKNPDQFILPGFHTAAENSLKSPGTNPGNDLFLATTGLMATGARTILISRWRPGGQTAIDLVREFVQELPYLPADEAWQRAVQLVSQSPLDPQREPRVKRKADAPPLNAQHPFFWAGYLLVDTGARPQKSDEVDGKLIIKFDMKKPAGQKADAKKADETKLEMPPKADDPFDGAVQLKETALPDKEAVGK